MKPTQSSPSVLPAAATPSWPAAPPAGALTLAVLHGGPSTEHDVSVASARMVLAALRRAGQGARPAYVDRDGLWHVGGFEDDVAHRTTTPLGPLQGALALAALELDCAFLAFHGTYGEDGRIQALLGLAGVPYSGSRVTSTAAAMDKPMTRRVYQGAGLPVAAAVEFETAGLEDAVVVARVVDGLIEDLGLPLVLKVPEGGSSIGVEIPRTREEALISVPRLASMASRLLCEEFIAGTELTAGVLEDAQGRPAALPIVEIVPHAAFFDYEAKYDAGKTDEIVPARISADATAEAQRLGLAAHKLLGCRGYSRTDLLLSSAGEFVVMETNTLPGLTAESLLPKAAAAVGLTFDAMVLAIIAASVRP